MKKITKNFDFSFKGKRVTPMYYWTFARLQEEAKKYSRKKDFLKGSYNAYRRAHEKGFLEIICAHMLPTYGHHHIDDWAEKTIGDLKMALEKNISTCDLSTHNQKALLHECLISVRQWLCKDVPAKK